MADIPVYILIKAQENQGERIAITTSLFISEITEADEDIIEDKNASTNLKQSAILATKLSHNLLYKQGLIQSYHHPSYTPEKSLCQVHGFSAGLAFVLAYTTKLYPPTKIIPAIAATGELQENGAVITVEGIEEKIKAAINTLPKASIIIYPAGNKISQPLLDSAQKKEIILTAVNRIEEALLAIGISLPKYHQSPFKGLVPLTFEDSDYFFGRTALIDEIIKQKFIKQKNLVFLGSSGSGKSSLVQAGILPALTTSHKDYFKDNTLLWHIVSPKIFSQMSAEQLLSLFTKPLQPYLEDINSIAEDSILTALEKAALHHKTTSASLIMVIDQFEELLIFSEIQQQVIKDILQVLMKVNSWMIITLRSDFMPQYQDLGWIEFFGDNAFINIQPPSTESLLEIIEKPAQLKDLSFEIDNNNVSLAIKLYEEASQSPHTLPLLAFMLKTLYEKRDEKNNTLLFKVYEEVGGLKHVIGQQAEQCLKTLPEIIRITLNELLPALVTINSEGKVMASSALFTHFNLQTQTLINAFVQERLLVINENQEVSVVHEALLTHWPRAQEQINQKVETLKLRDELKQQAKDWLAAEKNNSWLLKGLALSKAEHLYKHYHSYLNQETIAYIDKSKAQRFTTYSLRFIAVIIILASIGFGINFYNIKRHQEKQNLLTQANAFLDRGDWQTASHYYAQALATDPNRIDLKIKALRTTLALEDRAEIEKAITTLAKRKDLGEYQATVLLLQGDFIMSESGKEKQGIALVKQALDMGALNEADTLYAKGLIAETVPEAKNYFQQAITIEPFHHRANAGLLSVLILSGEFDLAHEQVIFAKARFYQDPLFTILESLLVFAEGDVEKSMAILEAIKNEENRSKVEDIQDFLRSFAGVLNIIKKLQNLEQMTAFDMVYLMNSLSAFGKKTQTPALGEFGLNLPASRFLFQNFFKVMFAYKDFLSGKYEKAIHKTEKMYQTTPDGIFLYLQGIFTLGTAKQKIKAKEEWLENLKTASDLFHQAIEAPSFCKKVFNSYYYKGSVFIDTMLLATKSENNNSELIQQTLQHLQWLQDNKELTVKDHKKITTALVLLLEDSSLRTETLITINRGLVQDWQQQEPDNIQPKALLAKIEFYAGNYNKALQITDEVLAIMADNIEVQKLKKEIYKQLSLLIEEKLKE